MNILMTGGTGFIGQKIISKLTQNEHHVYVLTRNPKKHRNTEQITFINYHYPVNRLPHIHSVINLAGESIFGRWTPEKKEAILSSRLTVTENIIQLISRMKARPSVFINASAIGYYGMSEKNIFTEETVEPAQDFLATVVSEWEKTALLAEDLGIRTVLTRFGIILDRDNGALSMMDKAFKGFVGGKIGNGEQWMSWIHVDDVVEIIYYAIMNENLSGAINVTAPTPLRNKDFTKILGKTLHRPTIFTVPKPIINLALGEMGQLVSNGQYVLPKKLLSTDYMFKYPNLSVALKKIYQ